MASTLEMKNINMVNLLKNYLLSPGISLLPYVPKVSEEDDLMKLTMRKTIEDLEDYSVTTNN